MRSSHFRCNNCIVFFIVFQVCSTCEYLYLLIDDIKAGVEMSVPKIYKIFMSEQKSLILGDLSEISRQNECLHHRSRTNHSAYSLHPISHVFKKL